MIVKNNGTRKPIKMWLDDIEDGAYCQAMNIANLPFAFKHVAIMPDSHQGYGMPIGGVLATKGVVIPNAVGVDIGCGMCAVRTNINAISDRDLKAVLGKIRAVIPVGFNWHKRPAPEKLMPDSEMLDLHVVGENYKNARLQLGTLGGGNHFIEIQHGSDDRVWIMIHSGSRNLGKRVADYYNKIAIALNERWYSSVPDMWQLAFLPIESKEAAAYMREMKYCVNFAYQNRKMMMGAALQAFRDTLPLFDNDDMINIAHNYAAFEHHFGENVIVHRKGATRAYAGETGIIPGDQGTKSYIVEGLGNPESFMSCSHGAGRKMGRKQALRELNLDDEIRVMNSQGIIHNIETISDLEEASGAYKDIDAVMENQKDLVKIKVELKPLAVIKAKKRLRPQK